MDSKYVIEKFGKTIVSGRDSAISNFDRYFTGSMPSKYGRFIASIYANLESDPKATVATLLPCIVDETITIMLQVLDELLVQGELDIKISNGAIEASVYDFFEQLEPYYSENDGWREQFTTQRIVDLAKDS